MVDDAQWEAPPACAGWRVIDVIAHLAALAHEAVDPPAPDPTEPSNRERYHDLRVDERRGLSHAQVIDEWRHYGPRQLDLLKSDQNPPSADEPVEVPGLGIYPRHLLANTQLEIDGRHVSRCYTISSPPTRPHLISITVKRVVDGPVSNWLHDNVIPGTRITVQAPLGSFTIAGQTATKYLFLSAGSGITPLRSMTRTLYDLGSDADILFIHSARTPADIIFRRELDAIASMAPNIRVAHICEGDHPFERWHGLRGRLSTAALQALAPELMERVTFTCGPSAYMASVRNILAEIGYDMRNYHEESFSFEALSVPARPVVDTDHQVLTETAPPLGDQSPTLSDAGGQGTSAAVYSVEFVRTGRTITCGANENVLDAAWTGPASRHPPPALRACVGHARPRCCPDKSTCSTTAEYAPGNRPEQDPHLLLQTNQRPPH